MSTPLEATYEPFVSVCGQSSVRRRTVFVKLACSLMSLSQLLYDVLLCLV